MPIGIYKHRSWQGFQKGNNFGKRFFKGIIIPNEWREKISKKNKGRKYPPRNKVEVKCFFCNKEYIINESEYKNRKHHFCSQFCYWNYIQGENAILWKGGISFKEYPLGWNRIFKEQIRYRDQYKCQLCGVPEVECETKLHIHHKNYDKKNINEENLVSLCKVCHAKTNSNREYWINYFKNQKEVINEKI